MKPSILIACVGNIFLGDDGFGVEVASALRLRELPECALVKDFGIRGFDLAYSLLDPWEAVILVDALSRGETPGTLYVVAPDIAGMGNAAAPEMAMNPHGMDPARVLHLAASMGEIPAHVFVVGCEPQDFGDELEGRMGLSAAVKAAVDEACTMVAELVARVRRTGNGAVGTDATQLQIMER
jgi:hydrogenase maturation protease